MNKTKFAQLQNSQQNLAKHIISKLLNLKSQLKDSQQLKVYFAKHGIVFLIAYVYYLINKI